MDEFLLVIESDQETAQQLQADLATANVGEVLSDHREGLDGVQAFVTILQAATPIIVAIMPYLIERSRQSKIRRVRVGDAEIENPTEEQVRVLITQTLQPRS